VPRLLREIGKSPCAAALLEMAQSPPSSHPMMQARFAVLAEKLPQFMAAAEPTGGTDIPVSPLPEAWGAELTAVREAAMVKNVAKKHWDREELYKRFQAAAKELRDMADRLAPQLQFEAAAAVPCAEQALRVMELARLVAEQYEQRKRHIGALDFNDLLIDARRLLVGSEDNAPETPEGDSPIFAARKSGQSPSAARKSGQSPSAARKSGPSPSAELRRRLAAHLRLLLVDEFQDTDRLQVELVKALCDNDYLSGKLFFVGDQKQSIYRFRGADPEVFRELQGEIAKQWRIPLRENFRSQPAILEFVNALFAEELPNYEPLAAHRKQVAPRPAVEFLWASDADDAAAGGRGFTGRERLRRCEADWIARRIRKMLDEEEELIYREDAESGGAAARAVKPGDIALLFRALTNVEYYEDALQRWGIDYYLVGGRAFYAQQEIFDVLNLLRSLASPADEVSLAGVLRSPMFSLRDETLFWLSRGPGGLAAGLFAGELPGELDAQQRQRAALAGATIGQLRAMKDRLPVAALLQEALRRTGYDALLLAEFLGRRKLANLQKLIEQARSFDRAGVFTLADFITQLAEFVARQPDEPMAATQPETAKVVRLMSIHQAKGLEFPVVIVPDVGRPRHVVPPPVAFDKQLGPMLKDDEAATGFDLFMARQNEDDLKELGRLFYVAATRAADYLILSAGVEDLDQTAGPWMEMLARRFDLLSGQVRAAGGDSSRRSASGEASQDALVRATTARPESTAQPVDLRPRRDLMKIVEQAGKMGANGQGRLPMHLAPIAADAAARRQYSFSRINGQLHARSGGGQAAPWDGETPPEPPLDPKGLGTLVHAVLAEIDFARPGDVAEAVRRLAEQHLPDSADGLDEPIEMIRRFLASPRAGQLAAAAELHRELEFLLAWPPDADKAAIADRAAEKAAIADRAADKAAIADRAAEKAAIADRADGRRDRQSPLCGGEPDGRYLQGYIDCLYRDTTGRWRLLDFKTNRVGPGELAEKAAPYELQMLVYALATETILGSPPAELTLCFLRPGLEYHFSWDAAARQRAIELVNAALL
jgi:ATP-dependent helicase/nuclease subunit A